MSEEMWPNSWQILGTEYYENHQTMEWAVDSENQSSSKFGKTEKANNCVKNNQISIQRKNPTFQ